MLKDKTDEFWDIYDMNRVKTGRLHRRGDDMKPGEYHLAVHVCIFNSEGQMLIQQRQPYKKGWTNMWDITVGGSAIAGDSSQKAAEREVWEELGLKIDLSNVRPTFTHNFCEGFDDYYIIQMDVDISTLNLQKEEVKQVRFADKAEVLRMQEEGIMIPYWFLDKLFEIRSDYDAHGKRIRNIDRDIVVCNAEQKNLASCMSMMEIIKCNIMPELDLEEYKALFMKSIDSGSMKCALVRNIVVGIAIFDEALSVKYITAHPEYNNEKICQKLLTTNNS